MQTAEIKVKLKDLKSNVVGVSKEINELENILQQSEEILFASSAVIDSSTWLLTCTDQRIILLDKGLFKGTSKTEIAYEKIWSLDTKKGLIFGTVVINTTLGGKIIKLEQLIKSDVDILLNVVEQQKNKVFENNTTEELNETINILQSSNTTQISSTSETTPISTLPNIPLPQLKHNNNLKMTFNIAGVTKKNDFEKDIQTILQKEGEKYCNHNGIELYEGMTAKEIKEDDYEVNEFSDLYFDETEILFIPEPTNLFDKNAIKVYIKYFENRFPVHIGYVPKDRTQELRKLIEKNNYLSIEAHYVGGKTKEPTYNPLTDKTEIEINELSLGINITISYKLD